MDKDVHSTRALVERARTGDQLALDDLMARHLPLLRAYVRAHCGPVLRRQESCSDLVQSVCCAALGSLENYEWRGEGSFRHWLCTVALYRLRDKHDYHIAQRRDPKQLVELDAAPTAQLEQVADVYRTIGTPSQHAVAQEVVDQVEAALDQIHENYREVILMSRVLGLSHAEIAERLDKSEGSVRVLLSRALTRLAAAMVAGDPHDASDPG